MDYNFLSRFFVGSSVRYADWEDASPVVYRSYAFVSCLDPSCNFVFEVPVDKTLEDTVDLCREHWHHKHDRQSGDRF